MTEPLNEQQRNDLNANGDTLEGSESHADGLESTDAPETPEDGQVDLEAALTALQETQDKLTEATQRGDTWFESLKARTMEAASADVLQAVDHMPADDPRYYDADGFPSLDGMREVAEELVRARPYLGKARGDVSQGVRYTSETPGWSDVLRGVVNG